VKMKMWNPFKKRLLKFKQLRVDDKYKIIPAFNLGGVEYFQFDDAMNMPAGRGLSAMYIYDEFRMKADKEYLELHIRAFEKLLAGMSGKMTLDLVMQMKQINANLKERVNLVALPDYCYKLASVHFFDSTESIYQYDPAYNLQKIEAWKKNPEALDFFLTGPLKDFLPFSDTVKVDARIYLNVAEKIANKARLDLQEVLSSPELTTAGNS